MLVQDIIEARSVPPSLYYHGTKAKFDAFDLDYIGKGNDKEGPGFYFSDKLITAVQYSGMDGRVLACRLTPRKLNQITGKVSRDKIAHLMQQSPELDDVLINFDENPRRAFEQALNVMILDGDPKESFERVWYDFYRDHSRLWAENMVRLGIDGAIVTQPDGSKHVMMYNLAKIAIVEVIDPATVEKE